MKNEPVILNQKQRKFVLAAILQVCENRGWIAHAVHVRANHVHVVVSGAAGPEKMMTDFKAYATRAIRQGGASLKKYWTRHGSTKHLWTRKAIISAINYVRNEQGRMMEFSSSNCCRAPNVSEG